ncbi:phospho-acceptor domain-containing protein [Geothermobacter ehrlichii]|uniref:histidine kinase n=1 Tax=Geothermobacter ehrlichii TaxID=213224 RepID=A0A5D3WKX5_9BACT|nr:ATP-binding protein [Geothermobacter ehrlichii]TYO99654.1 phospho-acceptor domain-containing protein [Geothermobacter ehrlichii]
MGRDKKKNRSLLLMAFLCLLIGIGVPLLNLAYIYPYFSRFAIEDVKEDTVRVSKLLSRVVLNDDNWRDWISKGMVPDFLADDLARAAGEIELIKLKFFLANGRTIYSTDIADVGKRNTADFFRHQVASGRIFARLVSRAHDSAGGRVSRQDVVEVFVPVMHQGRFVGAFELNVDVTDRIEALHGLLLKLSIIPTVLLLLAMGIMLWLMRNLNFYIQAQLDTEEDLIKALDESWQLTEEMAASQRQLVQQAEELEELNRQLKEAQAQMLQREKMASIGQLAAGVAHEINNPVGFVSSNIRTLKKYFDKFITFVQKVESLVDGQPDSRLQEQLRKIERELRLAQVMEDVPELIAESCEGMQRVKEIVLNLKSFSRVDNTERQQANLNDCLESTLKIVWNELKYKARVECDYGELPNIYCRPQELNQVFMNLLVNAAHAIEKEGEIRIRTWADDDEVHVAISDTGSGIPEEIRQRIFEPFFTTKEVGKGTGLGLSISWDIVQKHGGRLEVDSEVGKGTTFTISLPRRESDADEEMEARSQQEVTKTTVEEEKWAKLSQPEAV